VALDRFAGLVGDGGQRAQAVGVEVAQAALALGALDDQEVPDV
jgi:hypothetical protein